MTQVSKLISDKRAVTSLEYVFIAALISAMCVGGVTQMGINLNAKVTSISGHMP